MKYEVAYHSERGARPMNEDRVAVAERDNAVLMVVADGLGGHRGGEIAAEILVQTVVRAFQTVRSAIITRPSAFLALGILQAHQAILRRAQESAGAIQPRTTCVICLVQNGYAYWAHVGDSRLYHFRHGRLVQRTQDHSTVEELRQDGLVSEEEMRSHPSKGKLTKCVGGPNKPTIALGEETLLSRDDVLLLCSDGLWEAHTPEELVGFLDRHETLDEAVAVMLDSAVHKMDDGCDNVSVVCLHWLEKAPLALPLQGNASVQVDEQTLIGTAAGLRGNRKTAPIPTAHRGADRDIADEIRELEQYLRSREPKP